MRRRLQSDDEERLDAAARNAESDPIIFALTLLQPDSLLRGYVKKCNGRRFS